MNSKTPNNKNHQPLVFFGTGQTSLDALQCLAGEFSIELIITKPPARNSAGKLFKNQVQVWGDENKIRVMTPANRLELAKEIGRFNLKSEIAVVLDYGMIIPETVIDIFPKGILNSHFSLLPKYRGANPIRSAIISGDTITGVTIIRITPGLDDGPILTWSEQPIEQLDATELREKLSTLNCALLPESIKLYAGGKLSLIDQDSSQATTTTKTRKQDGRLDYHKNPRELELEIRAYVGWPKSSLEWKNKTYIIHKACESTTQVSPGTLKEVDRKLYFGCKNGSLEIQEIQPANKPKMSAEAFINGYQI